MVIVTAQAPSAQPKRMVVPDLADRVRNLGMTDHARRNPGYMDKAGPGVPTRNAIQRGLGA